MKTSKNLIVIGTIAFALMTTDALAEKCNGYVVSKASESVLLRKADRSGGNQADLLMLDHERWETLP